MKFALRVGALLSLALLFTHCGATDPDLSVAVEIEPYSVTVSPGATKAFRGRATVARKSTSTYEIDQNASSFTWVVTEGSEGGTLRPSSSTETTYIYTAPRIPGIYHVVIISKRDQTQTAQAIVTVKE